MSREGSQVDPNEMMQVAEPHKLQEFFMLFVPIYGDQLHLKSFLSSCVISFRNAADRQKQFLAVYKQNMLRKL